MSIIRNWESESGAGQFAHRDTYGDGDPGGGIGGGGAGTGDGGWLGGGGGGILQRHRLLVEQSPGLEAASPGGSNFKIKYSSKKHPVGIAAEFEALVGVL